MKIPNFNKYAQKITSLFIRTKRDLQSLYLVNTMMILSIWKNIVSTIKEIVYPPNYVRIHIEGNIASGKTTLIKSLAESFPAWTFVPEPVSEWVSLLKKVQDHPGQHEFVLQTTIADHYRQTYQRLTCTDKHAIIERSSFAGLNVFALNYLQHGLLSQEEFDYLRMDIERSSIKFNGCIFIDTPPHVCLERGRKRGRNCENKMDQNYLIQLDNLYKKALEKLEAEGIAVCIIDGQESEKQVKRKAMDFIQKLI